MGDGSDRHYIGRRRGVEFGLEGATGVQRDRWSTLASGTWRFAPSHRVGFQTFSTRRHASKVIDQELVIEDEVIPLGTNLETTVKTDFLIANYQYSLLRDERVELSAMAGVYGARAVNAGVVHQSNGRGQEREVELGLVVRLAEGRRDRAVEELPPGDLRVAEPQVAVAAEEVVGHLGLEAELELDLLVLEPVGGARELVGRLVGRLPASCAAACDAMAGAIAASPRFIAENPVTSSSAGAAGCIRGPFRRAGLSLYWQSAPSLGPLWR